MPSSGRAARREAALGGCGSTASDEDFVTSNKTLSDYVDEDGLQLRLQNVKMLPKENKTAHHTDEYECRDIVLRRGQEFNMKISFDRKYNKERDTVVVKFVTGARPKLTQSTIISATVTESINTERAQWKAAVTSVQEADLNLSIWSPADAVVGKYRVVVETTYQDGSVKNTSRKNFRDNFILLFNPWCKDDQVYMENEEWRKEYVLNDTGCIWMSLRRNPRPWNFGQFENECIDAALYLLKESGISDGARSNPVLVARTITQMANANDEGGVLMGRWHEPYHEPCTLPWQWSGSASILEEFMKTKESVRFGQCWVFSGLVTTLLRALGIGTRSITNFNSAHDTDESATIDCHVDENGEEVPGFHDDSIWNFHVWNESWMKRPDLPEGFDGWQAIDATPQERSEGMMKCGPAPVKAIKEGLVYLPYDTKFIFAEVNGDRVHWMVKKDGTMEPIEIEKKIVGHYISTKALNGFWRNDVTLDYKYAEGTEEERRVAHRVFRHSSRKERSVYDIAPPDVVFRLNISNEVTIGQDFGVKVTMTNQENTDRHVHARICLVVSNYTGVSSKRICVQNFDETLSPKQEKTVGFEVLYDTYKASLRPEAIVTAYMKSTVRETGRSYAKTQARQMEIPSLFLQAPKDVKYNETFQLQIFLDNPLNDKLTNCKFNIEGRGIAKGVVVHLSEGIAPKASTTHKVDLSPHSEHTKGHRQIIANFSSDQLKGMTGYTHVRLNHT